MKQYCPSCGQATEYAITPPNFCGSCGKPYNSAFAATPVKAQTIQTQPPACACGKKHEDDDDGEATSQLPQITQAAVEIHVERPKGYKYAEIAGTGSGGFKREPLKVDRRKKKRAIAQEIMSVCESSKGRNADVE